MNKIAKYIESIRGDYKAHFIIGVFTAFPMVLLFGNIGGLIAILLYAMKEIVHDNILGKGNMEFMDWLWSSMPAIFYMIIYNYR